MASNASEASRGETTATAAKPAYWSGAFAMSLCVFALVASEFTPVSLQTPIAGDLGITEGMAGQGIAISGACAVLTSLLILALAGDLDRKKLLPLTVLMGVSGALMAMAPIYPTYLAGRALIGVVIEGFWSMSAAMAIRLMPASQVPRALAFFKGGNAIATVIAAPPGSYLGAIVGWRGAFFALVPVALIVLAWEWLALPAMRPEARAAGAGNVFKVLRSRTVACGIAGCGAFFMGQFTLFTYLRSFFEKVTRLEVSTLSLLLLVIGVARFIGTLLIASLLKRGLYGPLITIPLLPAMVALALIPLGTWMAPVAVLLRLWGLLATAAPLGWRSWIAQAMPEDVEARGRPDGGGHPVRHRPGLRGRRRPVRCQRLSEHLHHQRCAVTAHRRAGRPDPTGTAGAPG